MSLGLKDANLISTIALPNGAASVTSPSIDLGLLTSKGELDIHGEWEISAPALTTGQLGDAATMIYDVVISANSDMSSPTVLYQVVLKQTGAGGVGAIAAKSRFRLPLSPGGTGSSKRYLALKATNSAAGNASAVSATLSAIL